MSDIPNGAIGDITGLPLWSVEPFHHLTGCPGGMPMILFGGKQSCALCIPCNIAYNVALDKAQEAVAAAPSQYSWGMGRWHFICAEDALAAIAALRGGSDG